jgi:hypothetical protein
MFGLPQRIGLKDSDLPQEILETLSTEEELKNVIKHVQNESYVTDKGFLNQNTVHQGNQNRIYNMEVDMELLGTENLENETMRVEESVEIVVDESTSTKDLFLLKNFVAVPPETNNDQQTCVVCDEQVVNSLQCERGKGSLHIGSSYLKKKSSTTRTICLLCRRKLDINKNRVRSKRSLQIQAESMRVASNKKFKTANIGDNVLVRIPDVGRGRAAPRNVMAVVTNVTEGFYKLGTKNDTLPKLNARNGFQISESSC